MNLTELLRELASPDWQTTNRHLRLHWRSRFGTRFEPLLLPQVASIREGINTGMELRITCFMLDARQPLNGILGQHIALKMLTDQGTWRSFPGIVTEATAGRSDGAARMVTLVARDPLSIMAARKRLRVFTDMSVLDVVSAVFNEWIHSGGFGSAFTWRTLGVEPGRHPRRGHFIQFPDESDAAFVQRLLYPGGLSCCWRPEALPRHGGDPDAVPRHELLLFDDGWHLPACPSGPLRYLRQDSGVLAEGIELLSQRWTLVPGGVAWTAWDHERGDFDQIERSTALDQGEAGDLLADLLLDTRLPLPHPGNDGAHLERLSAVHAGHHAFRAHGLHGRSNVRTLSAGTHAPIQDYPAFSGLSADACDHVIVQVEHWAMNNLPVEVHEAARDLIDEDFVPPWVPSEAAGGQPACRYANRFTAVHRTVRIVPTYETERDAHRPRRLTGIVVAVDGEVSCDGLGRCKVRLLGAEPGLDTTAWVRHVSPWAGRNHGFLAQLRVGAEVDLESMGHDRLVIVGCHFNGKNLPPLVAHRPGLPRNRFQTALVAREIGGTRQQHLLFDDTPGQQMAQLATDVADTALSLGALTTPRQMGQAAARGNGFELRTDASGAVRTAMNLLLTAWKRLQASGEQASAEEHVALMQDCLDLFKSLGQVAARHQGQPVDDQSQARLKADVEAACGNGADRDAGVAPTISITAPAGIAATTPETILHYAGVNIDTVAMQHLQFASGARCDVNAGKGLSMFSHEMGITAIAHRGPLLLQSQHDETRLDSARDIKLEALGKLVGLGHDEVTFMTSGGAFLKLSGGDVEIGGPGALRVRTATHHWDGPASLDGQGPAFGEGDLGRAPRLLSPTSGEPVPGMQMHVKRAGGDVDGESDAAGQGPRIVASRLQRLKAYFLDIRS